MRAGVVTARNERSSLLADARQRSHSILLPFNACRIGHRTDNDEVVVHDRLPLNAEARIHERLLGLCVVDEDNICIAVLARLERLPGAKCDYPNLDTRFLCELRQEVVEEARLFSRGS